MARLIMLIPMCGLKLSLNKGDEATFEGPEAVSLVDANFAKPADAEAAAEIEALRAELEAAAASDTPVIDAAAEAAAAEAAAAEAAAAEADKPAKKKG